MSKSAAVLPVTKVDVGESSVEAELFKRISALEPDNADVVSKEVKYRVQGDANLQALLADNSRFESTIKETAERIRDLDFVPEWPVVINGKSMVLHKSGRFEVPDDCVDYLREQLKAREPENYEEIMNFIMSQCPLYITDVLQASETLEFAIDEYKQDRWSDDYRPFSVVYRSQSGNKGWWWNRWFGIGKGEKKERADVEGNPPIYPGETATCQEDLDDDLADFSNSIAEQISKQYSDEADRIVGMLLNMPAMQRQTMMENSEYLNKKAAQCHALLQDKTT